MRIKCLWSFLFLMCCSCVFLSEAKSQQVADVAISFDQDTVSVTGGQTFSNKISIRNLTDKTIELIPSAVETMSLSGLIKLPQRIILQAREQKSYPLKYMGDRNTLKNNHQSFSIGFSSDDQSIRLPKPVSFFIKLNDDKTLVLQAEEPEYYLDQSTHQVQFRVKALNTGMIPVIFKVLFSGYPQGFEISGEMMLITLQPGAQILLPFSATKQTKSNFQDFDLSLEGLDERGHMLSKSRVRILQTGSVKRFGLGNNFEDEPYNNAVALRYMSMSKDASFYQLQGNGDLHLEGNRKLNYRFNFDHYQNPNTVNIYDTYIDYQEKDWGVKVGNIFENLDQTISGRGVKASFRFNKNRSISLYGVENNYMLFSQQNNIIPGSKIVGANYAVKSAKNLDSYLTFLHSEGGYRGIKSDQISGKSFIKSSLNQQLWIEGGYSVECADQGEKKHAIAAGLNYNYYSEKYQIMSLNYYSSPFYTGLRRGLIQSDTRISKMLHNNNSIAARVSFIDNDPKYQQTDHNYFFRRPSRVQIYELGYHIGLGNFQMDFKPYLMIQQAMFQDLGGLSPLRENWKSSAIRSIGDFNFNKSSQRFSLRADYGYNYRNTSNKPVAPFHSLRLTGNYTNRFLGFNTYIQINPYYLNDLLSMTSDRNYSIYSFGPSTQFTALKGNLQTQLSSTYNYYGFLNNNNISATMNTRWRLGKNWTVTADIYYTVIHTSIPTFVQSDVTNPVVNTFDNRQIRFGIEKNFSKWTESNGHKLQLVFFDDRNNNGVLDAGESMAEGLIVKIERNVARTDVKGLVKFLNVATGSYVVDIENNQGWIAQEQMNIVITKNQILEIPLVKSRILKGKIKLIADKYLQTSPDLSGIRINAVDQFGKNYSTLSDANGCYTFYLPLGNYTVSIPTEGMTFSIENSNQVVELTGENVKYLDDFNYKDGRRKVGIKRF